MGDRNRLFSVLISYYEKVGKQVFCIDHELPFDIPMNWCWTKLNVITEILDSNRVPVSLPERKSRIASKELHQLYPYYGATGLVGYIDGYIFDGEYILLGEDGAPFLDRYAMKAYKVVGRCWVNNHAHILRPYINGDYLLFYLNSMDFNKYVHGTTRLKLTQTDMCSIFIPVPSKIEQENIVKTIAKFISHLKEIEVAIR